MRFVFPAVRRRPPCEDLIDVRLRLFDERNLRFARLRDARVLIYWPHGFGDFVHLGYLLPMLEPSNRYWIARYGDDFSELYRDNTFAPMLPSGIQETSNIFGSSARDFHLGVRYGQASGRMTTLAVTATLAAGLKAHDIDSVLWTDYPDAHGGLRFPYHTKIRSLAHELIETERLAQFDLTRRLCHAVAFNEIDTEARAFVDDRLQKTFGAYAELCLIQSGGHTAAHKSWEEDEVLAFATRYCAENPQRAVLLLNDIALPDQLNDPRIATWHCVFDHAASAQDSGMISSLSYARLISAVLQRASLMVGVPAGPTHAALATGTIPTVVLWRAHHPFAYEEPNDHALHVVSESIRTERSKQWQLASTVPPNYLGEIVHLPGTSLPHAAVADIAARLLS